VLRPIALTPANYYIEYILYLYSIYKISANRLYIFAPTDARDLAICDPCIVARFSEIWYSYCEVQVSISNGPSQWQKWLFFVIYSETVSGDRISVVEARFPAPVQTVPGALSASCTMGNGVFSKG